MEGSGSISTFCEAKTAKRKWILHAWK